MVHYKLIYFNRKARAEVTRILFFLGGQEFEDVRIDRSDIQKYKPIAPFGQLPVLEVDGVSMCQSHSINRYLAKLFGYAGKTPMEEFRADMIVDCAEDIKKARPVMFGESAIEEEKKKFEEEKLPVMLSNMEAILKDNKGGDGFFVGDALTWADLTVHQIITWIQGWQINTHLEKTPTLEAFINRMESHPKLVEWREKTQIDPHPYEFFAAKYKTT